MAIFLITGASGVGKTTIADKIAQTGHWKECISTTTRPKRNGEIDGKTYYFMEEDDFADSDQMGEFAEMVEYDGNYYGITHKEIERVMKSSKHVYIIVEFNGYEQIKKLYPEAVGIFLHMSKEDCMANMLLRGDSFEKASKRIESYDDEMKNRVHFDYVIKNVRDRQFHTEAIIKGITNHYQVNTVMTTINAQPINEKIQIPPFSGWINGSAVINGGDIL